MTVQAIGDLSIAGFVPFLGTVQGVALTQLNAKLAGLVAAQARLTITPPSFSAGLVTAAQITVNLGLAIQANLPTVSFQLSLLATLIAALEAQLALINLNLSAGVFAYRYDGRADGLYEFGNVIPGGVAAAPISALLVGTQNPAAWTTMKAVFATGNASAGGVEIV